VGFSVRTRDRFKALLGTASCVAVAVAVSLMGQTKPGKSSLPIWFLAVIMGIVFQFGSLAGLWGTIFSAITFAVYLFEPIGRLAVRNAEQKNHLMWMVLIGLAISIFGHPPDKKATSSNENNRK
jgi:K+-sensing histidine kinase KdpD